jgi:hypothetical protein
VVSKAGLAPGRSLCGAYIDCSYFGFWLLLSQIVFWPLFSVVLVFCYVIICLHLEDFFLLEEDGKTFSIISWGMAIAAMAITTLSVVPRLYLLDSGET